MSDELEMEFAEAAGLSDPTPAESDVVSSDVADVADEPGRYRNEETGQWESEAQRQERLLAGRYETPEQLENAYQHLQQRLGEQGNELGALRQWYAQQQQFMQQQQYAQQPGVDFDEIIDEDPEQAVQEALRSRNPHLYERAIRAWADIDPISAQNFQNAQWSQVQQAQLQATLAPFAQAMQQQYTQAAQWQAVQEVQSRIPDFAEHGDAIVRAAEHAGPGFLNVLHSGDSQQISRALEMLYFAGKGMLNGAVPQGMAPPAPGPMDKRGAVASGQSVPPAQGTSSQDVWADVFERGLQSMYE